MENQEMGLWAATVTVYVENDKGKVKGVNHPYLVNATSPKHVIEIIEDDYRGSSSRWRIASIKKSNIVDVLNYSGVRNLSRNTENDRSLMLND